MIFRRGTSGFSTFTIECSKTSLAKLNGLHSALHLIFQYSGIPVMLRTSKPVSMTSNSWKRSGFTKSWLILTLIGTTSIIVLSNVQRISTLKTGWWTVNKVTWPCNSGAARLSSLASLAQTSRQPRDHQLLWNLRGRNYKNHMHNLSTHHRPKCKEPVLELKSTPVNKDSKVLAVMDP